MNPSSYQDNPDTECEFTCAGDFDQLLGPEAAEAFLEGQWGLSNVSPDHVAGVLDKAAYPTYQIAKTLKDFASFLRQLKEGGMLWGRGNEREITEQRASVATIEAKIKKAEELVSLEESEEIDEHLAVLEELVTILKVINELLASLFCAHTKPVNLEDSPFWANIKGAKNELGQAMSLKTAHPGTPEEFQQFLRIFAGIVGSVRTGIVERVIVKYEVEPQPGKRMYMDVRADRVYQLNPGLIANRERLEAILKAHFSPPNAENPPPLFTYEALAEAGMLQGDPFLFISGETELDDKPVRKAHKNWQYGEHGQRTPLRKAYLEQIKLLKRAMGVIHDFYEERGALKLPSNFRWHELALSSDPRAYVMQRIKKAHPGIQDEAIVRMLDKMQEQGRQVFRAIQGTRQQFENLRTAPKEEVARVMNIAQLAA